MKSQLISQNKAQQQAARSLRLQQENRKKIIEASLRRLASNS